MIDKNINWDVTAFFASLTETNKFAKAHDFVFAKVCGLDGFEEALQLLQFATAIVAVSDISQGYIGCFRLSGKVLGMFFLFHSILYLCIMNMLEQLARIVLPKEILDNFDIVKIETDESDIDSMSMTIYLDERMNAYLQKSEDYESKGFMDAVRITDFPIRDHKVILVLRRRRWKNKETGETFVDRISVTESGTRYSKEFAAFLKETYGHIPDDLPYA